MFQHYTFTDSHGNVHFIAPDNVVERVTLESVYASNLDETNSGWAGREGREDLVRLIVREYCA